MRVTAMLHTVQNLGDHGREIEIGLDVGLNTTLKELLHDVRNMGSIKNDYITLKYIEIQE